MDGMIDCGKKHNSIAVDAPDINKKYYPNVYLPLELLKGKSIGDLCRIEITGKITGMSEREDSSEVNIEIRQAKYIGKAGKATKEEYTKMSDAEREAHDKRMMEEADSAEDDDDESDG